MHKQVIEFIEKIKSKNPTFFRYVSVLDCGSLDINGSNRGFFADSVYMGIDIVDGRNVDFVTRVHNFTPNNLFDVVISTEMLEHDIYVDLSLAKMVHLLRPGGLLIITAAGYGREEHGTTHHHPNDSPLTHDYYMNLTASDFSNYLQLDLFSSWEISQLGTDIRFVGFKRNL